MNSTSKKHLLQKNTLHEETNLFSHGGPSYFTLNNMVVQGSRKDLRGILARKRFQNKR